MNRPSRLTSSLAALAVAVVTSCGANATTKPAPEVTAPAQSSAVATEAPSTTTTTVVATTTTVGVPSDDSFYVAPPGAADRSKPGTLIWSRPFAGPPGTRSFTILYWSSTVDDKPVAVSGTAIIPDGLGAGARVITWAHGTTGMGDRCAPSRAFVDGTAAELGFAPLLGQLRAAFVATDYQGLGPPGDHTYLVGRAEGRDVLDAARALQQLPTSPVDSSSPVLVWGHSQGGGAAAWAAELAPGYAPDMKVVGALVGAPAGELLGLGRSGGDGSPGFGFGLMALIGFHEAYPDLPLDASLNDAGRAAMATVRSGCNADILPAFAGRRTSDYFTTSPVSDPDWQKRLAENSPAQLTTPVPIFIYHGEADDTVPSGVSAAMLAKYCRLGDRVKRTVYPGAGHTDVIVKALPDLLAYANARWAGEPAPTSCA